MLDRFNRHINYLRISVTDRCNLRCTYCMPEDGVKWIEHNKIITYEEIVSIVKIAVDLGIDKFRITGGEPLVRKGIVDLIHMLSLINGVKDLALTTNGILLENFAEPLAKAGLNRINISLDTLNPEKFKILTRGGDISDVLRGIDVAKKTSLSPIKINCVVKDSSSEKDALEVKEFCIKNGLQARFIHQMNLAEGSFAIVEGGSGGDCKNCNRLRVTSNAKIKPCLFRDTEYDIRALGIEKAFELALLSKPEKGSKNHYNCFNNIGG